MDNDRLKKLKEVSSRTNKEYANTFNDIKIVNIDDITISPFQPRKTFDEESIIELSKSIEENGLLQPISITKNNILIAGERRLRACKILNLKTIKAIFIQNVNDEQMEILAIIENLQREELDIFDESKAIHTLVSKSSIRKTAKSIAKTVGYTSDRFTLGKLNNKEINYIQSNNLLIKEMLIIANRGISHFESVCLANSINIDKKAIKKTKNINNLKNREKNQENPKEEYERQSDKESQQLKGKISAEEEQILNGMELLKEDTGLVFSEKHIRYFLTDEQVQIREKRQAIKF